MNGLRKLCRGMDKFFKFFFYLSGFVLFCLLVVSFIYVFSREILQTSLTWGDEAQRYLMIIMVFVASPYLVSEKGHLIVDLVDIFMPKRVAVKRVTHLIGDIILLAVLIYLMFPTMELALKSVGSLTTALQISKAYLYGLMPATFLLSIFAQLKNMVKFYILKEAKDSTRDTIEEI